jgi:Protein of unknown function (DUF1588)/Protein of unknown function (DUF1592)/Protein of unknown function (DUF1585)/Protein of unknown function (DUF1595)/Protein of unknown function (DUF1587)
MMRTLGIAGAAIGIVLGLAGCRGDANSNDGGGDATDGTDTAGATTSTAGTADSSESGDVEVPDDASIARIGLRRITRYEFDNIVRDLLLDDSRPAAQLLPEDLRTPFDNDYTMQLATQPLVDGIEVLARRVAQDLVADAERRATVVGCAPAGVDDDACMRSFIEHFGRLALRRPLSTQEVDDYVALGLDFAGQGDDFWVGIEVVVRAFLQDTELVYRVELGTAVPDAPGTFALGPYELASRMSFFLWGSTPDDALLDAAAGGELDDAAGVHDIAASMLADERAHDHVDRFHSLWLGYAELPHAQAITSAMRRETAALIERVVFDEQRPWSELFSFTESYIDDTLAELYGMPAPDGGAGWVPYDDNGRMGLLSHGSFLSVAANVADTSPTRRGKFIREQLMCTPIPPPPPNVNADEPPDPAAGNCKVDQYLAHATGSCATCHDQMDPIGFGLENYDKTGRYRTHDDDKPECVIPGDGELTGVGTFNGPDQLAQLLLDADVLDACVTQQLYRYALGRELEGDDATFVAAITTSFDDADHRFDELLVALVANPAFGYRREEE